MLNVKILTKREVEDMVLEMKTKLTIEFEKELTKLRTKIVDLERIK